MATITAGHRSLSDTFIAARKVSIPLIVVRSGDHAATIAALGELVTNPQTKQSAPALRWEAVNGLAPVNTLGTAVRAQIAAQPQLTIPDVEMLTRLEKAPAFTCTFMQNAHLFWKAPQTLQAIWNLRDLFKRDGRTLVLLTTLGAPIPTELANDVVTLEEPLPTKDQLAATVRSIYESVQQAADDAIVGRAVEALAGVRTSFLAEQNAAICMTKSGVNIDDLWAQKKALINDTPGLRYMDPTLSFADLGGCDALKTFFKLLFTGAAQPSVLVFMDEIDDMFAGVGGDTSGVSTVMHGKFLTQITKTQAKGVLLLGHPGVGKSAIVEAAAHEYGKPLVGLDFGDIKNSLVGASEERTAQALAVIDAISFGRALYIGTCNSTGNLSPQLMRRFPWRFFFDLPTKAERKLIWPVYEQRPHADASGPLTKAQLADRPDDANWTGAEIRECCENAWRFSCSLAQAANYVVPIARSRPEDVDSRRKEAANRYLSASYPGEYRLQNAETPKVATVPVTVPVPRFISDMKES